VTRVCHPEILSAARFSGKHMSSRSA
jgi:hypothetical protein